MNTSIERAQQIVTRGRVERFGLHEFARQYWDIVDPGGVFQDNWHIGAIAEHLQAVSFREIKRLVINVPPRSGKSTLCSVLWPAWHWTWQPEHRWCFVSYAPRLIDRDAAKMIALVQHPRYSSIWPIVIPTRRKMRDFHNTRGGGRQSTILRGDAVGHGSHTQVVDDPVKTGIDTESATNRDHTEAIDLWQGIFSLRRDGPPEFFARVVIMQRLAERDLAGFCLEQGYEHLCLPMRYVPRATWDMGSSLPRLDPRTTPGEILAPRFAATIDQDETDLGPIRASAQLQQNPTPPKGSFVDAAWFRRYDGALPVADPRDIKWIQSWDFGFKGNDDAGHSRTHGLLAAVIGGKVYLRAEAGPKHANYPEAKRMFLAIQHGEWEHAAKFIEDKANGTPILDDLADDAAIKGGMIRVEPRGTKAERLARHSDKIEGGVVYVPEGSTWDDWIHEIVAFPKGTYDDRVDTLTQLLDQIASPWEKMRRALRNPKLLERLHRAGF